MTALLPAMLLFGAAMSLFDVAINTEGSALESVSGRAIMSNLHGMFSVGGMAGAALASFLLASGVAPRLAALRRLRRHRDRRRDRIARHARDACRIATSRRRKAHFAWPKGLLLVIGVLIFAGMTAEGVMYDWSVLYLKQEVGMPQAPAALGYATFCAAMALSRFGGDVLRARYPERGCCVRCEVAAVAMAIVLLSSNAWVSFIGFALRRRGARASRAHSLQRRDARAGREPRRGDRGGHVDRLQRLHDRAAADRRHRHGDLV